MANIKIYTTPTCPHCKEAKAFLQASNIEYEEVNVLTDRAAMEFLAGKGFMGVPVIAIGEELVQGFDEGVKQKIQAALS